MTDSAAVDALLELFDQGVYQPTAREIEARAGVPIDNIDELTRAAIDRAIAAVVPLAALDIRPDEPTADKIAHVVTNRLRLWDAAAPVARAARALGYRNKMVATQTDDSRAFLRGQLSRVFAPEFERDEDALPVVDALCSFEVFDLLTQGQGLSLAKAEQALTKALTAVLQPLQPHAPHPPQ